MRSVYINICFKITLAAISGLCCGLAYDFYIMSETELNELSVLGLLGILFAAGVLFPYLSPDRSAWPRGIGLIGISMLSFLCATTTFGAVSGPYVVTTAGFVAGSVVGAAIVLTGAMIMIPSRRPVVLAVAGFPAAIVGGLLFWLLDLWFPLPFIIWHLLMAVAIYIAEFQPAPPLQAG
jgi:hypothetical protein